MLFNSFEYIVFFLPTACLVFFILSHKGYAQLALTSLIVASLFFYGWWNPLYLILIVGSMLFNYGVGYLLLTHDHSRQKRFILVIGIIGNLGLLGYFKYANFFVNNVNLLFETSFHLEKIILPLAISFFSFQQIAYLVDVHKGLIQKQPFTSYCLFVCFFPQLIAGPIVHHSEMMPQFQKPHIFKFNVENLSIGIALFSMGLFKKVVLADNIAFYVSPVFLAAEHQTNVNIYTAWSAALAYTCQLYFDFSGYTDMAMGAARLFGINLPINFNSPYKSNNIIEFWRRWHMTLSRFLKDYVYVPLGGNRKGHVRRFVNLLITMLLGGIWHGAGWTFVIWGLMHGVYLVVNHLWQMIFNSAGALQSSTLSKYCYGISARLLTFFFLVIAWVVFRAHSLTGAKYMLLTMFGFNDDPKQFHNPFGSDLEHYYHLAFNILGLPYIGILLLIMFFAPNSMQIVGILQDKNHLSYDQRAKLSRIRFQPSAVWAVVISLMVVLAWQGMLGKVSEFLYFQF